MCQGCVGRRLGPGGLAGSAEPASLPPRGLSPSGKSLSSSVSSCCQSSAGPSRSLYEALGLEPDAADAAVRGAYKKAAVKWHPDKHVRPFAPSGKSHSPQFPAAASPHWALNSTPGPGRGAQARRGGWGGRGGVLSGLQPPPNPMSEEGEGWLAGVHAVVAAAEVS